MTVSSVLDRISQIQSQFQQLSGAGATSASDATSSADFSSQLDSALGSTARTSADATPASATAAATPAAEAVTSDYGTAAATPSQQAVLDDARKYLGVPYLWGGTDPSKGLDCSGFVQRVYGDLGIQLPRVSGDQARAGTQVDSLTDAQPGDVLAFGSPVHHVAIYAGNGEMIEAPHTGDHVKIIKVADFGEPVTQIRRILPSGRAASSSSSYSPSASTSAASPASAGDSLAASRTAFDVQTLQSLAGASA